jgi:SET domain-containing protein
MPNINTARVKVKRSPTGLGLFAGSPFEKDDLIIEYVGEMISNEEADRRGGRYLFEISSKKTIDGKSRQNTARYLNHSCRPNTEPEIDGEQLFIYALREIQEGEELTFDYGKEYFDEFIKPYGCKCAHCQGEDV